MSAASSRRTLTPERSQGAVSDPGTASRLLLSARTRARASAIAQSRGRRRPEAGSSSLTAQATVHTDPLATRKLTPNQCKFASLRREVACISTYGRRGHIRPQKQGKRMWPPEDRPDVPWASPTVVEPITDATLQPGLCRRGVTF